MATITTKKADDGHGMDLTMENAGRRLRSSRTSGSPVSHRSSVGAVPYLKDISNHLAPAQGAIAKRRAKSISPKRSTSDIAAIRIEDDSIQANRNGEETVEKGISRASSRQAHRRKTSSMLMIKLRYDLVDEEKDEEITCREKGRSSLECLKKHRKSHPSGLGSQPSKPSSHWRSSYPHNKVQCMQKYGKNSNSTLVLLHGHEVEYTTVVLDMVNSIIDEVALSYQDEREDTVSDKTLTGNDNCRSLSSFQHDRSKGSEIQLSIPDRCPSHHHVNIANKRRFSVPELPADPTHSIHRRRRRQSYMHATRNSLAISSQSTLQELPSEEPTFQSLLEAAQDSVERKKQAKPSNTVGDEAPSSPCEIVQHNQDTSISCQEYEHATCLQAFCLGYFARCSTRHHICQVIKLQTYVRKFLHRRTYLRSLEGCIKIQKWWKNQRMRITSAAAVVLQSAWRRKSAIRDYRKLQGAAIFIQYRFRRNCRLRCNFNQIVASSVEAGSSANDVLLSSFLKKWRQDKIAKSFIAEGRLSGDEFVNKSAAVDKSVIKLGSLGFALPRNVSSDLIAPASRPRVTRSSSLSQTRPSKIAKSTHTSPFASKIPQITNGKRNVRIEQFAADSDLITEINGKLPGTASKLPSSTQTAEKVDPCLAKLPTSTVVSLITMSNADLAKFTRRNTNQNRLYNCGFERVVVKKAVARPPSPNAKVQTRMAAMSRIKRRKLESANGYQLGPGENEPWSPSKQLSSTIKWPKALETEVNAEADMPSLAKTKSRASRSMKSISQTVNSLDAFGNIQLSSDTACKFSERIVIQKVLYKGEVDE